MGKSFLLDIEEMGANESTEQCRCVIYILEDYKFVHETSPCRMGSVFDDFGWMIYRNEEASEDENKEIKVFGHKHLGVVDSFSHSIVNDADREKLKEFKYHKFEKDNSLLPQIKSYITANKNDFFE